MYYYPFLSDQQGPLGASITLSNYPPIDHSAAEPSYVYSVYSVGTEWVFQEITRLDVFESMTITRESLSIPRRHSVFLTMSPTQLSQTAPSLIMSDYHQTTPDWRANLCVSSPTTQSSYQGEYPSAMLKLHKSSMVSLCSLTQLNEAVYNKVFLVNLFDIPDIKTSTLYMAGLKSQHVLKTFEVASNTVNCISLPNTTEPSYLFNPDMVSIPIYLAHNQDYTELSLEHSHPPHEFTMGGYFERHHLIKNMKHEWIQRGLSHV